LFSFWFFSFSYYTDYSFKPPCLLKFQIEFSPTFWQLFIWSLSSSSQESFESNPQQADWAFLDFSEVPNWILSLPTVLLIPIFLSSELNSQLAANYAFDPSHLLNFQIEFSAGWVWFWRTVRILS
jgi:hypothetical protein